MPIKARIDMLTTGVRTPLRIKVLGSDHREASVTDMPGKVVGGDFLNGCKGGRAMNIEALDGFFAALIAGPEVVMSSEYYPEVFGGEMSDTYEFASLDEANEILGLMMRHWNSIAGTLFKGEVYVPLLLEDKDGVAQGNDWARGFMRGRACATTAGLTLSTTTSTADA